MTAQTPGSADHAPAVPHSALRTPRSAIPSPRQAFDGSTIYTVSQLTRQVREALERHVGLVWLTGEISNLRVPASGHCYFTLKDESAQIAAVMWRTLAETLKFKMADGLSVVAQGEVTVYEPRGQCQISVRRIEPLGVGALQLAFMQMKERLAKEGLFDPARKRPVPAFPRVVALVTSPAGAAIRDMLRVIRRRCPSTRVIVCPVRVQGDEAAGEIAAGIALVNRLPEVEVMIVGRGGGSIEDLWPFNEEVVARAIAGSRVPVISAVGHETDFTISDFVADLRALTPTDAANQVVPDVGELAEDLDSLRRRLGRALTVTAESARESLAGLARLFEPRRLDERIREREQRADELCQRLVRGAQRATAFQGQRLGALSGRLESLSPYAVLRRGYSITLREEGAVIRDAADLRPGDLVRTRLHRGEFRSRVENTSDPSDPTDPSDRNRKRTSDMPKNKPKFEEHLARLEKIVADLEGGDLTLDDSLAKYEEGVKALKKCYEILRDAEKRVEVLLKSDDGELKTAPFEPEEEAEPSKEE